MSAPRGKSVLRGKSEPKTGNSVQDVSGRNKRPSKYKPIEPSKLADLLNFHPDKYRPLHESTLDHLSEQEQVRLVFHNREDLWVHIQHVDHETETVCGNITSKPTKLEGLQIGQLVNFKKEHIVEVQVDDDSDDDDYY
ncbi:hypothetical protein WJX73_003092 [Symbiochloris irregularis]|uniref:Uncharacterized protein n=1 Tax=Symbiochloris irregularis TaxID=706552 RepID=A0AAW1Q096_9CHLO